MDTENIRKPNSKFSQTLATPASVCVYLWLLLSGCAGNIKTLTTPTLSIIVPTETLSLSYPIAVTPTISCIDGLSFIDDLTIPDYSIAIPGSILDKQWLVQNSGSCNWDSRYRLRFIAGVMMGASPEQALFPARAGMQAIIRIAFTAPLEIGEYDSEWQAYDSEGFPFGESFLIKIIVQ